MTLASEVTDAVFEADVLHRGGLVLVEFWAPWCTSCRQAEPRIEAAVHAFAPHLAHRRVNVEESPETVARLGVRSTPTLVLFRDGEELGRLGGATVGADTAGWIGRTAGLTPSAAASEAAAGEPPAPGAPQPFFSRLSREGAVRDILLMNRAAGKALIDYHLAVLRQPSALTPGQRELIAAYVSGLNACQYCHGVHSVTAEAFGLGESVIADLMADPETADIDDRMRPILHYARKLTREPARLTKGDYDAVMAAGWDEQALHDAINVVCLFNFMNRLVEGHGVKGSDDLYALRGQALHDHGYAPIYEALGFSRQGD